MKNILSLFIALILAFTAFSQDYKAGTLVEIKWNNTWYKGSVLEVKDGKYKVSYDGWSSSWNEWVSNERLRLLAANTSDAKGVAKETKENNTIGSAQPNQLTGATPKAGKWEATISNGYKGDKLTFKVSLEGKRVEDVAFTGYWQKRNRMAIEVLKNLDPPEAFGVNKGSFSAVQQVPKAGMWWEFIGRFVTATTAEGTYRAAFAGGENDTYKLQWSAKWVSP